MNTWLFFALTAPFLWGMTNLADAAIRRHFVKNDLAFNWFAAASRLPLLLVLFWWGWPWVFPSPANVLLLLAGGFLWMAPTWLYFKAIHFEEPSRVALLLQLVPLFTLPFAFLLLGEKLAGGEIGAFALLILGGIFAAMKRFEGRWHLSKALPLMALAIALWSFSDVLFKKIEPAFPDFFTAFTVYLLGSFLFCVPFMITRKKREETFGHFKNLPLRAWVLLVGTQAAGIGGSAAFAYALTLGKASLTTVLIGLQPLFVFGIGLLLKSWVIEIPREDLSGSSLFWKSLSLALVLAGLWGLQ